MTTNDYFDQEMRVMTPDKVLQPRAFALGFTLMMVLDVALG